MMYSDFHSLPIAKTWYRKLMRRYFSFLPHVGQKQLRKRISRGLFNKERFHMLGFHFLPCYDVIKLP